MNELKRFILELWECYEWDVVALAFLNQYLLTCPLELDDPDAIEYIKADLTDNILNTINDNIDIIRGDLNGEK